MTVSEGCRSVEHWLGRLAPSTARIQRNYFSKFMEWLKENGGAFKDYTPDMLIEHQKQADNGSSYDVLDVIQLYIGQCKGRQSTKNARYNNVRSFFAHNRCTLPKDPTFKVISTETTKPPIRGTLTVDEIKKCVLGSRRAYQAIYLSMFQACMDQECFTFWNLNGYGSLMEQLNQGANIIRIDLPGRKKNRNKKPFYTFIGDDAISAIKNWLEVRPRDAKAIFTNQYGKPVTKQDLKDYWLRQLRRTGIVEHVKGTPNSHRTGKNLHEMRDVWRSLWSKSPASNVVAEFMMGHSIDEYGYDKSYRDVEFYKSEYVKALPYLNILSRGEAFGRVDQNEVERLRRENQALQQQLETNSQDALKMFETLEKRIKALEKQ